VQVPSLRERVDDIPLLVRYFAQVDRCSDLITSAALLDYIPDFDLD